MTSKVRWAIIGASQIARSWVAGAIRASARGELTTLMSRDLERGNGFAKEFGIPHVVTDLDDMLKNPAIDAVYVSTGNDRHAAVTMAAAKAGKHVLCEKPLSLELDDAVAMAKACDDAGVIFGTNHHMRMAATHRVIRDLVIGGRIGKVLAARAMYCEYLPAELQTWRTHDPAAGGVIYDLTVHNIDALRFALGLEPLEAMSMKASTLSSVLAARRRWNRPSPRHWRAPGRPSASARWPMPGAATRRSAPGSARDWPTSWRIARCCGRALGRPQPPRSRLLP
mgnify:CR=1 FL=1